MTWIELAELNLINCPYMEIYCSQIFNIIFQLFTNN